MKKITWLALGCLTLLIFSTTLAAGGPYQHKISPKIGVWLSSPMIQKIFRPNPSPSTRAPVSIRFRQSPLAPLIHKLEKQGVRFTKRPGTESPLHLGLFYSARATAQGLNALAQVDIVQQVDLDTQILRALPLDLTVPEIQTPHVWARGKEELPLSGEGMIVGDMDTGIEHFHPAFFKADGKLYAWLDTNSNHQFDPLIDAVDLNNNGIADPEETLGFFDAEVISMGVPILNSANNVYDPAYDWLYADTNGNLQRDFGPTAGFNDTTPTFGEPLFVIDDLNQNDKLDPEEKLVTLGTSKVLATYYKGVERKRGVDLSQSYFDDWASHGTAASSIMIGGHQGFQRRVGIAPQAEILMTNTMDQETPLTSQLVWLSQSGAQVILHEYAPWTGYHLDGSSNHELLMDQESQLGIPQITPAGNLGGLNKHMRTTIPPQSSKLIPIDVPGPSSGGAHYFMQITLLWRNPEVDLEFTLQDPTGRSHVLPPDNAAGTWWDTTNTVVYYTYRTDSSRGTAMMDVYIYGMNGSEYLPIPTGNWTLTVNNPHANTSVLLLGYLSDAISVWDLGIAFTQDISEEGLICWPATADSAITVAAYAGHSGSPFNTMGTEPQGALRSFSGRGIRIDGEHIMDIAAPDNPVVAQNQIPGFYKHGAYGIFGGTSGAGPHVAGAAILIKQFNPLLDALGVHQAIRQGALVDAQVGMVPSDSWGYGKLRIYRSIFGQDPIPNTPPLVSIELPEGPVRAGIPAKFTAKVQDSEDPLEKLQIRWDDGYDGSYDTPYTPSTSWTKTFAAAGKYSLKVQVKDSGGMTSATAVLVQVEEAPPTPEGPAATDAGLLPGDNGSQPGTDSGTKPSPDDGCGCRLATPNQIPLPWLLAFLLFTLVRRRRGR